MVLPSWKAACRKPVREAVNSTFYQCTLPKSRGTHTDWVVQGTVITSSNLQCWNNSTALEMLCFRTALFLGICQSLDAGSSLMCKSCHPANLPATNIQENLVNIKINMFFPFQVWECMFKGREYGDCSYQYLILAHRLWDKEMWTQYPSAHLGSCKHIFWSSVNISSQAWEMV